MKQNLMLLGIWIAVASVLIPLLYAASPSHP